MKAVIAGIVPQAAVIDLTHGIPRGDIRQAAFRLWQAEPYLPAGTVVVLVVDPGVGTERRAVAVQWAERKLVAPDNGALTYLLAQGPPTQVVELTEARYQLRPVSSTFHGRDVFSPAGAHLAAGVRLHELGPPLPELVELPLPRLESAGGGTLEGQIVHVDGFGNLITSIGRLQRDEGQLLLDPWLPSCQPARIPLPAEAQLPDGTVLPLERTFGDVPPGEPVAYLGSEGLLEIAINGGDAAEQLDLAVDDPIRLGPRG